MKKLKLNSKLTLNKETISRLDSEQMNSAKGGGFLSIGQNCTTTQGGPGCTSENHTKGPWCNETPPN